MDIEKSKTVRITHPNAGSRRLPDQMRHMTELALIGAIPNLMVGKLQNGRLKGQLEALNKACNKALLSLPKPNDGDIAMCDTKLKLFGKYTGWEGETRHIATLVSFCLMVIEESRFYYPVKIITHLNNIFEYCERGGDVPAPSAWAGSVAAEKWESLFWEK